MDAPIGKYQVAAKNKFAAFVPLYGACNNYWRLGHSFDAAVDYLGIDPAGADDFGQLVLNQFNQYHGAWYDDFGWWGIAMLRASALPCLVSFAPRFTRISLDCWNEMDNSAPNVWRNAPRGMYADFAPLFPGGVWNACWQGAESCRLDGLPNAKLAGIQNTVTNGLYWVLASRWFLAGKLQDFRAKADREYQFLQSWFTVKPEEDALWWDLPSLGPALVRERVSKFASYEGRQRRQQFYSKDFAWSGDQGLIIGGLVDRMTMVGAGHPDYALSLLRVKQIVSGVQQGMSIGSQLQPWCPMPNTCDNGPGAGSDWEDYRTGPAVFWRYLLYAWRNNADVREYLSTESFRKFLRVNADQAAANVNNPHSPCGATTPCYQLLMVTNDLAVLTAAVIILGN